MSSIWSRLINLAGNITGVLPVANGGTALSAVGTANQVLGTNSGATALEYKTLAVGSTGTDFAVANAANSVTFNLPDASATARGVVNIGTQTIGSPKTIQSTDTSSGTQQLTLSQTSTGQVALTLARAGGTVSTWIMYAPQGSTDLRFYSGSDQATLTTGGVLTVTSLNLGNTNLSTYVQDDAQTSTFTFNGTGSPGTTGTITFLITKIGRIVNLQVNGNIAGTTGTTSTALISNTAIPVAYRPAAAQNFGCFIQDSGADLDPIGIFQIATTGVITIKRTNNGVAFSNGVTAGTGRQISVTYKV